MKSLNYKTFGSGEPLIILHGLLGSLDNWQSLAKLYAQNFTVFIIDQRNHGRSFHSQEFNYDLLTQDLLDFCDSNYIYKTHILGHSMGGKVAMQFAVEHTDYVEKLIVADIAPVVYPPGHNEIFEALHAVDLQKMQSREEVELILAPFIPEFGTRQFLMKGLTRNEDNQFEWKFNLASLWDNYPAILNTFTSQDSFDGKALFINGEKSSYVLDEYKPLILKHFPKASFETIPKVGHWLHAENPNLFFEKTYDFLKS